MLAIEATRTSASLPKWLGARTFFGLASIFDERDEYTERVAGGISAGQGLQSSIGDCRLLYAERRPDLFDRYRYDCVSRKSHWLGCDRRNAGARLQKKLRPLQNILFVRFITRQRRGHRFSALAGDHETDLHWRAAPWQGMVPMGF